MAKLSAPLLSLKASQKLGDALVYFGWKGINCVRTYVIPSNPKTTLQNTQRGHLTDAVEMVHTAQAEAANPLDGDDVVAYEALGSIQPTPRTWFNEFVRQFVNQRVASLKGAIFRDGSTTPGVDELAVSIYYTVDGTEDITTGNFWYGTSKSALIHSEAGVLAVGEWTATLSNLVTGVKYYWQFRPTAHANFVGTRSGIYSGYPT